MVDAYIAIPEIERYDGAHNAKQSKNNTKDLVSIKYI